jgi:hypothetical protein
MSTTPSLLKSAFGFHLKLLGLEPYASVHISRYEYFETRLSMNGESGIGGGSPPGYSGGTVGGRVRGVRSLMHREIDAFARLID